MEPAGFAIGIIGLFKSVVVVVNGLSSIQSCDKDLQIFAVMVQADRQRLLHWGLEVGLYQGTEVDGLYELHARLRDPDTHCAVYGL